MPMIAHDLDKQRQKTLVEKMQRDYDRAAIEHRHEMTEAALEELRRKIAAEYGMPLEEVTMHVCRRGVPGLY